MPTSLHQVLAPRLVTQELQALEPSLPPWLHPSLLVQVLCPAAGALSANQALGPCPSIPQLFCKCIQLLQTRENNTKTIVAHCLLYYQPRPASLLFSTLVWSRCRSVVVPSLVLLLKILPIVIYIYIYIIDSYSYEAYPLLLIVCVCHFFLYRCLGFITCWVLVLSSRKICTRAYMQTWIIEVSKCIKTLFWDGKDWILVP